MSALAFFFFFSSRRRHTRCGRDWSSDVCSSDLPAEQLLIGGAWREAASGRRFDVTDPATGEVVGSVADADRDDVSAAIDAASAAFPAWAATPAIERGRLLRRAADLMRERSAAIAAVMTAEQGK